MIKAKDILIVFLIYLYMKKEKKSKSKSISRLLYPYGRIETRYGTIARLLVTI